MRVRNEYLNLRMKEKSFKGIQIILLWQTCDQSICFSALDNICGTTSGHVFVFLFNKSIFVRVK